MALVALAAGSASAAPLLPDLIAWETTAPPYYYMHDGSMDQETIANRVLYRFSQPIANIGAGPLELREETDANLVQDIYQRIYDSSGSVNETFVGTFPNANPPYGHLFLVGIAEYRIRTVTSGGGVGPVFASQIKTSYGLYDYDKYNTSLPGAPAMPRYNGRDPLLGISVGWADVYPSWFPGQSIDVTDLPNGEYWLEAEVDPFDLLQESNEANNVTRILVELEVPEPLVMQGDYNNDGVVDSADYVVWRKMLGQSVPRGTSADGDGNGAVEAPDLNVWHTEFGSASGGGGLGGNAVPEPATAAALLLASACYQMHVRRRGPHRVG